MEKLGVVRVLLLAVHLVSWIAAMLMLLQRM